MQQVAVLWCFILIKSICKYFIKYTFSSLHQYIVLPFYFLIKSTCTGKFSSKSYDTIKYLNMINYEIWLSLKYCSDLSLFSAHTSCDMDTLFKGQD